MLLQLPPDAAGRAVFGVQLDCEINNGETLVVGGNLGVDGKHEITLITPSVTQDGDGHEAIMLTMKVVSVGDEFIAENGLKSLAANADSMLQVAEAWDSERNAQVMERSIAAEDSGVFSSPSLIVGEGQDFKLSTGQGSTRRRILLHTPRDGRPNGFGWVLDPVPA